MKMLSTTSKLMAIAALLVVATVGAVIRARAQTDVNLVASPVAQFGILGITRGQTARLSVANVSSPDNPLYQYPPPCRVTISFVDADGNVLINNAGLPVRREVTLEPGHAAILQINGDNLVPRDQPRLNFRPVVGVFVTPNSDATTPPDPCVPTLEVIDNSSAKTTLLSPGTPSLYMGTNHNQTLLRDE